MEPKEMTNDEYISRIGALALKLEPFQFELKPPIRFNNKEVPGQPRHQIFHSPYCGDVDFSAVHIDAAQQYALAEIVYAARAEGERTAKWKMREALGLNPTN